MTEQRVLPSGYEETLSQLYELGRFGMKPGLTRIRTILSRLSNPQDSLQVVHVAGTNGKGSTAAFLAAILSAAGHRVGLFTSPHLIAFTERIRINGTDIRPADVMGLVDRVRSVAPEGSTFFEIVTAMAYLHFAEERVGPAVMEVGMGGRFDATNAADGVLALIAPVALDHCEHLGNSLAQIAREKAGIIRAGRPVAVVQHDTEVSDVFQDCCRQAGSTLYRHGVEFTSRWEQDLLIYDGLSRQITGVRPGIPGRYQAGNAALAACGAELLDRQGLSVSAGAIRSGLEHASWPGRMELFPGQPPILLDGAHNPAGAAALAESLREEPHRSLILVIGMVGDKDSDGIISPLLPLADRVITVSPAVPRSLSAEDLAEQCRRHGHTALAAGSVADGIDQACSAAVPGDLVVVCGSLFTVGEARSLLLNKHFEPFRG